MEKQQQERQEKRQRNIDEKQQKRKDKKLKKLKAKVLFLFFLPSFSLPLALAFSPRALLRLFVFLFGSIIDSPCRVAPASRASGRVS